MVARRSFLGDDDEGPQYDSSPKNLLLKPLELKKQLNSLEPMVQRCSVLPTPMWTKMLATCCVMTRTANEPTAALIVSKTVEFASPSAVPKGAFLQHQRVARLWPLCTSGEAEIEKMSTYKRLISTMLAVVSLRAGQRDDAALKDLSPVMAAQVKAIAEYRIPMPGSGPFEIEDGRWYRALTEEKKKAIFQGSAGRCLTFFGRLNCAELRSSLDWFYADRQNLLIPFSGEAYVHHG